MLHNGASPRGTILYLFAKHICVTVEGGFQTYRGTSGFSFLCYLFKAETTQYSLSHKHRLTHQGGNLSYCNSLVNYTAVRYNIYLCGLIKWDETEEKEDGNKGGKSWRVDEEKYLVLIQLSFTMLECCWCCCFYQEQLSYFKLHSCCWVEGSNSIVIKISSLSSIQIKYNKSQPSTASVCPTQVTLLLCFL